VRVPSDPSGRCPTHIELKTLDATANPYLALGAVIAAGLDGICQNLDLGDPVTVDPGHLSTTELQQQGITRLPSSLAESLGHLRQDSVLLDALGADYAGFTWPCATPSQKCCINWI
jgi:glutamine synthetase